MTSAQPKLRVDRGTEAAEFCQVAFGATVLHGAGYLPVLAENDEAGPAAASATITHHHQAAQSVTGCHSSRITVPTGRTGKRLPAEYFACRSLNGSGDGGKQIIRSVLS